MSKDTPAKAAGEIAFENVLRLIKEKELAETGACVAAGLAKNILAQARSRDRSLSLPAIEKFAGFFGVTKGELMGEVAPETLSRLAVPAGTGAAIPPAIRNIPLFRIQASALNPRKSFDADSIAELAESIAAQGLLQNLFVKGIDGRYDEAGEPAAYEIVAGERRWRAITLLAEQGRLPYELDVQGIPCRVAEVTPAEHLALAILENLMRKDVNAMEEAEGFAKLQAMDPEKYTTAYIAEQIGTSQRHVQLRMEMVSKLAPTAQAGLRQGEINVAQARALTSAPPAQQKKMLENLERYATAEQLQKAIKEDRIAIERCDFPTDTADVADWIFEDHEGKRWFAGREKFLALQRKHADRIVAQAVGRFAWAERQSWFSSYAYEQEKAVPVEKGGCVVVCETWNGEIKVHEGLIRKDNNKPAPADHMRQLQVRKDFNDERDRQSQIFRDSLATALRSRDAMRLILFAAVDRGGQSTPIDIHDLHMPIDLVAGGACKALCDHVTEVDDDDYVELQYGAEDAAWDALCEISDGDLGTAMARIVHAILDRVPDGLAYPLRKIAEREGIEIPPLLLLDTEAINAEIARRMAEPDAQTDIEDAIAAQADAA